MVSKASEDLPDPDRPVKTMSESRGRSSETFLRLCSRAPRTMRRSATPVRTFLGLRGVTGARPPCFLRLGGATDNAGRIPGLHNNPRPSSMPDATPDHIARAFDLRHGFTTFTQRCGGAKVSSMIDHGHDLASVRDAMDRLLTAAAKLDNA